MAKAIPLSLIEKLPKTDLHVHLDGSLRLSTILDLARAGRIELPATEAAPLAAAAVLPAMRTATGVQLQSPLPAATAGPVTIAWRAATSPSAAAAAAPPPPA